MLIRFKIKKKVTRTSIEYRSIEKKFKFKYVKGLTEPGVKQSILPKRRKSPVTKLLQSD